MKKIIATFVDGVHRKLPSPLPAYEQYQTPDDVPVPLRHNLKYAHESGLTAKHLALIYELPEEWVEEFIEDRHE